jgi:predicted amidophosphoribosyltransferase
MKMKPEVELGEIKLLCPKCGEELTTHVCSKCGCEIDMSEITIDIQPEEILGYE